MKTPSIIFIDYHLQTGSNGILAYRNQLLKHIAGDSRFRLIIVDVCYPRIREVKVEVHDNITEVKAPFDLAKGGRLGDTDRNFANLLSQIAGSGQSVLHLNWINHALFGDWYRNITHAKVLLTKHCVPWRENIVKDYVLFNALNEIMESKRAETDIVRYLIPHEHISLKTVNHIITVTEDARKVVTRLHGIPSESVTIIHNGLECGDDRNDNVTKRDLRQSMGFEEKDKIILFTGSIYPMKGPATAFEIMKHLSRKIPSAKLVVCGSGLFQETHRMVPDEILGRVMFTGNLDALTLHKLMCLADAAIMPSLAEQCSYAAIEMMSCGLPVLMSDIPGLSELCPEDACLTIPTRFDRKGVSVDCETAASQLAYVLSTPSAYAMYSAASRRNVAERFSSERMVRQTIEVYQNLIDGADVIKHKSLGQIHHSIIQETH